jgi:hypothetical protein
VNGEKLLAFAGPVLAAAGPVDLAGVHLYAMRSGRNGVDVVVELQAKDAQAARALADRLGLQEVPGEDTPFDFEGDRPDLGCQVHVFAVGDPSDDTVLVIW